MGVIKNYDSLNSNENRKIALELIEAAFDSVKSEKVLNSNIEFNENILKLTESEINLDNFDNVYIVGFGKGSAEISKYLEEKLEEKLTAGFAIDVIDSPEFHKIKYTKGTHPLPSQVNIDFTKEVLDTTKDLTEKDLVLVVICGGGSAMFESPVNLSFERLQKLFKDMLRSGADITEMNIVRKHVSNVKGGNFAKHLFPASVASLIFSDVPGNDLSTIASGTTTKDTHTTDEARKILEKYNLLDDVTDEDLDETPKEDKYFEKVKNNLILSNITALNAMKKKAEELSQSVRIYTEKFEGDARSAGERLINEAKIGEILLAGGETTIKVTGTGRGGRNQALALSALPLIDKKTLLAPFSTDGWDFYGFAGAIVDQQTKDKVKEKNIDESEYLRDDNSYEFFKKIGDGIDTGKMESNVSDLYIVIKE